MFDKLYDIRGPGMVRAMQEAVSCEKNIVITCEWDNRGYPSRVGYFLADKGKQLVLEPKITWFAPEEIQITVEKTQTREFKKGLLGVEFFHPKK